jgi:hypothetical protein
MISHKRAPPFSLRFVHLEVFFNLTQTIPLVEEIHITEILPTRGHSVKQLLHSGVTMDKIKILTYKTIIKRSYFKIRKSYSPIKTKK